MRLIIITHPQFIAHEASAIETLLRHGTWAVHLRKPDATAEQMAHLIEAIPQEWHARLVLHDHLTLAQRYSLKGVHLNRRNPEAPEGHRGSTSCSTHSLPELAERLPGMDYCFLSPIFNSISKEGYGAAFSASSLLAAKAQGLIGPKVFALGGVSMELLDRVSSYGFGGAALLGDVWQRAGTADFEDYVEQLVAKAESL